MTPHVRPRRMVRVAAIAAAIALTAAGCGGSDIGATQEDAAAVTQDAPAAAPGAPVAPGTAEVPGAAEAPVGVDAPAAPVDTTTDVANPGAGPAANPGAGNAPAAPGAPADTAGDAAGKAPKGKKAKDGAAAPAAAASAADANLAAAKAVADLPIFGGSGTCKPATLSEINIGNVSTLSGVLGEVLAPSRSALETFAASQNACGGLGGHKFKLIIEDDQGDPATSAQKATKLIEQDKVLALVGNTQVLTVDGLVPVIKRTGIPVIGGDLTSNTWFTNKEFFPQGSGGQSVAYGYLVGAVEYHKETVLGDIYCLDVPRACEQVDRAFIELAPTFGAKVALNIQSTLTQPSYVNECLRFKEAGVKVLAMTFDAASQTRVARSCEQVQYFPKVVAYPLAVGNEAQFFGNDWLGNTYIPMNHFPWMAGTKEFPGNAAMTYYADSVAKFNPGFDTGGAAALAWNAGALLTAAGAGLSAENPTSQQLIDTLHTFKGQKFTELGGLTGPLTFNKDGLPQIPYCLFAGISNDANTGWKTAITKPTCTDVTAPSDPQTALKKP